MLNAPLPVTSVLPYAANTVYVPEHRVHLIRCLADLTHAGLDFFATFSTCRLGFSDGLLAGFSEEFVERYGHGEVKRAFTSCCTRRCAPETSCTCPWAAWLLCLVPNYLMKMNMCNADVPDYQTAQIDLTEP
jgi:hypothetical protein